MLLEKIHRKLVRGIQYSFSQEGEDLVLARIFEGKKNGFYVDIGAHHPTRFSNTHYFYRRGWSGINIDAMPGSMKKFNLRRKRDKNLEIPISLEEKDQSFFIFNEPALNSFDEKLSMKRHKESSNSKIIKIEKIKTMRLETILDKWLPINQKIDFMSVDVEGLDLSVLKSNNWNKYRPFYLVCEVDQESFNFHDNEIIKYMSSYKYELFSKCVKSIIFKLKEI